jgi:hypothetical protein
VADNPHVEIKDVTQMRMKSHQRPGLGKGGAPIIQRRNCGQAVSKAPGRSRRSGRPFSPANTFQQASNPDKDLHGDACKSAARPQWRLRFARPSPFSHQRVPAAPFDVRTPTLPVALRENADRVRRTKRGSPASLNDGTNARPKGVATGELPPPLYVLHAPREYEAI